MSSADDSAPAVERGASRVGATRRTPRQVAREENLARIRTIALQQLAQDGAAGLSLRAVAREMGLVSSAMYRYYPSRDDLVTDLVLDAYRDLAETLEQEPQAVPALSWVNRCLALRGWALAEPHRYALLYGSPIPGYAAPASTIAPATRVVRALLAPALLERDVTVPGEAEWPETLVGQLGDARRGLELGETIPRSRTFALVGAVARVHGLIALELNGQFVGAFEPADLLFAAVAKEEALRLGLS